MRASKPHGSMKQHKLHLYRSTTSDGAHAWRSLLVAFACAACGSPKNPTPSDAPIQEFSDIPPDRMRGPNVIEFNLTEQVIPAGHDVVLCHYLDTTEEELYVRSFESFQGEHGHHLIIFKALVTDAPGTVRDCTSAEDMVRFTPVISSVQFGLENFPEGMAIRVPKGAQIVLQQHYVNTMSRDIVVRDRALMTTMPKEEVKVLAGFYGLSQIFFELPPGEETSLHFDCAAPSDLNILLMGPHMHEWGTSFTAKVDRHGSMETILDVKWESWMRDEPPVRKYERTDPLVLRKGEIISTTCTFRNTTRDVLEFPREMCATYGYFFPAIAGEDTFLCGGGVE